jgi:signal transduction histidine kinase
VNVLTHYVVSLSITAFTFFFLAIFVYFKNRKKVLNQTFAFWALTVTIWSFGESRLIVAPDDLTALFLARLIYAGVIFIAPTFVHFVYVFLGITGKKRRLVLRSLYLFSFISLIFNNFTNLLTLSPVAKFSFNYYWEGGILFLYHFIIWWLVVIYGLFELFKAYSSSTAAKRNQIKYVFLGALIGYSGGAGNFLPVFNIEIYPYNPLGTYGTPLFPIMVTYAIFAYRLMDIRVVITRSLAYGALTAIIAGTYIGLMAWVDGLFSAFAWYSPLRAHSLLFILVFFALIYVLPRVKTRAIEITRQTLFRGKYDYQDELSEAARVIPSMLNLEELGNYVLDKVRTTMLVNKLTLFVYEEAEHSYRFLNCFGVDKDSVSQIKIEENSALAGLLRDSGTAVVKEDLERAGRVPREVLDLAEKQMEPLGAELCIPLMVKDNLTGIFTINNKGNGEIFTEDDLSLLTTVVSQVALTIEYIKSIDKISSNKRYVGLGKASMRMAHDIKNPLVPIKTFLQILPDKYPEKFKEMGKIDPEFTGRFYESALDGVDRINLLIERALHYARYPQPVFAPVQLHGLLDDVLDQEDVALKKAKIQLKKRYTSSPSIISADGEQLMELFSNLISNSIDAMEKVKSKKLQVRTKAVSDRMAVEIVDNGCGIPKDKIGPIFDPFITYKLKGSGLGLAIAKKIVDDHKGLIEITSTPGKGTTFRVLLPRKQ